MPSVLVIGGTGHFGGRICRRLSNEQRLQLLVSSRSLQSPESLAARLDNGRAGATIMPVALDLGADTFAEDIRRLGADVVIHTAGPYQGQDYTVARACIEAGSHYVDLADGREFVAGIAALDEPARAAGVSIVAGGSTMPGTSSAMIDAVRDDFSQIHTIESSIAPAHKTPRGISTYQAGLAYCGKPFNCWRDGRWRTVYGWQHLERIRYPELGLRFGAICDVPDLELIPDYVPGVQTVEFRASLEAPWEQLTMWLMAALTRLRLVSNWQPTAAFYKKMADRLMFLGSDKGGLHLRILGLDPDGRVISRTWYLVARRNHGPEVPCSPALLVTRKLLDGTLARRGAFPCLGLFTVDELRQEMHEFDVEIRFESAEG